jgi:hypothetical protein
MLTPLAEPAKSRRGLAAPMGPVESHIHVIRAQKVMLDNMLA